MIKMETSSPLANYPETLKAAYVLNAPKVFQIVFRIVKVTTKIEIRIQIAQNGKRD